jgi:hypothetical protein
MIENSLAKKIELQIFLHKLKTIKYNGGCISKCRACCIEYLKLPPVVFKEKTSSTHTLMVIARDTVIITFRIIIKVTIGCDRRRQLFMYCIDSSRAEGVLFRSFSG